MMSLSNYCLSVTGKRQSTLLSLSHTHTKKNKKKLILLASSSRIYKQHIRKRKIQQMSRYQKKKHPWQSEMFWYCEVQNSFLVNMMQKLSKLVTMCRSRTKLNATLLIRVYINCMLFTEYELCVCI